MTIGNSVTSIGNSAFEGCKNMEDMYCFSNNTPYVEKDAFKDAYIEYTTLHVPQNSVSAYKKHSLWGTFGKIVALTEEETAIKTLTSDDEKSTNESYTIDGRPSSTLQTGVNILRMKDGKTKKVLVK